MAGRSEVASPIRAILRAMSESAIRPARTGDLEAIAEIQHLNPTPELLGLASTAGAASRLGRAVVRSDGISDPLRPTVVYERDGRAVAFLQYSIGHFEAGTVSVALVLRAVMALRWRAFTVLPRLRARQSVHLQAPPDTFYIAEIHVHPGQRGQGIGSHLMIWTQAKAQELKLFERSLITRAENPAIHLYERHGFKITKTASSESYTKYYAVSGRVLMTAAVTPTEAAETA